MTLKTLEATERAVWSDEQRALILDEMDRIFADPAFKTSKRCQSMLDRLIRGALSGDLHGLKERTLGVEAFGRDPNYDTNNDPIVRTTATEIRKRLAQLYQDSNRPHAVRIRLLKGSYHPEFDFEEQDQPKEKAEEKISEDLPVPPTPSYPTSLHKSVHRPAAATWAVRKWALVCTTLLMLIAAFVLYGRSDLKPKQRIIWEPFLDNTRPLTLSIANTDALVGAQVPGTMHWQMVGDAIESRDISQGETHGGPSMSPANVPLLDARVAQKLSVFLGSHGRMPVMRDSSSLNLGDFHRGPVILIDTFNPWSVVLLSNPNLRYSVQVDPSTHNIGIRDARNPTSRAWTIDGDAEHHTVDYAIITRFFDNETNEWILGLCGLWSYGTEAATNLLIEPEFLPLLPDSLAGSKNFQIVVKTSVINGSTGVPQVIAVHTW